MTSYQLKCKLSKLANEILDDCGDIIEKQKKYKMISGTPNADLKNDFDLLNKMVDHLIECLNLNTALSKYFQGGNKD